MVSPTYQFLRDFGLFDIVLPYLIVFIPLAILLYKILKYKLFNKWIKPENALNTILALLLGIFCSFLTTLIINQLLNILTIFNTAYFILQYIVVILLAIVFIFLIKKMDFR